MLKISMPAPNRIDTELSGLLDAETMRTALDDLIEKSEDVTHGRILNRITDFTMPTAGAIGVELRRLPKLFGLIGKFDRCAVLSDVSWIRTVAEIEGAFIPGLEIKSFELHDVDAAETWLAGSLGETT